MLHSFIEGSKLRKDTQPLYDMLLGIEGRFKLNSERRQLHESDPDALYRAYLLPITSEAEIAESNAIGRLRKAQYVLQCLKDAYLQEEGDGEVAGFGGESDGAVSGVPSGGPSVQQAFADRLRDIRTPEEILASVRVHDRIDFTIAAVVSSLAFLLTVLYVGNFGTWQHYVGAFVAGASGSLTINWALLPWARSYIGGGSTGGST